MTQPRDARPPLDPDEAQFIARLAAHYTPAPLTPTQRVMLDNALWARLQRRRRTKLRPALATIAAGMLVTWLAWSGLFTPMPRGGEPRLRVIEAPSRVPWEYEVIFPREFTDASEGDDSALLPEDYRVIAQVFLDR